MNSSITRLSVWKNNFGAEGAEASPQQNRCEVSMDVLRLEMTMHCRHIRLESFTSKIFQDHSGAGRKELASKNKSLRRFQAIASVLMVNRSVKVINLEGNNIGVLGAKAGRGKNTTSAQRSKRIELRK